MMWGPHTSLGSGASGGTVRSLLCAGGFLQASNPRLAHLGGRGGEGRGGWHKMRRAEGWRVSHRIVHSKSVIGGPMSSFSSGDFFFFGGGSGGSAVGGGDLLRCCCGQRRGRRRGEAEAQEGDVAAAEEAAGAAERAELSTSFLNGPTASI